MVLGVLAAAFDELFFLAVPALRLAHRVKPLIKYGRCDGANTEGPLYGG